MSDKRYHVIYTGELAHGMDKKTVLSNLVLSIGLTTEKAAKLLDHSHVLLKRCGSSSDAKRLADKFQQAGAICIIQEHGEGYSGGEDQSALVSIFKKFARTPGKE